MDLLEIYQAMGDVGISYIEFAISTDGWDVKPVFRDGYLVAVLKFQGPEFHFHSFGKRSFTRAEMMSEIFTPLWNEYGFARTKTPIEDTRQQRFNERFGFRRIGRNEHEIHYQIDRS